MPSTASNATDQNLGSGIQTSSSGERHIPQSTRPDGSVRKEIKIRPGYRPPEDVEVYKNRTAEAWKNRGTGGIPGAEGLSGDSTQPAAATAAAQGKNAKRREARRKAKAAGEDAAGTPGQDDGDDEVDGSKNKPQATKMTNGESKTDAPSSETQPSDKDPEAQREKQARSLKKKLRQARELKEKNESEGSLLPEQFAKVIKINELIRQLDQLGFDENGEPKEIDDAS